MQHNYHGSGSCRSNLFLDATVCPHSYSVGCRANIVSCLEAQYLRLQTRTWLRYTGLHKCWTGFAGLKICSVHCLEHRLHTLSG